MTLTEVRRILTDLDLRPSRALGQNFLVDANIARIILAEADLRPDETVLEIGPGLGALTADLAARSRRLVAIEKDRRLCRYLRERFPTLELIEGDALEILDSEWQAPSSGFQVVSNLPYRVATPILERLVEGRFKPRRMVLTLQREVALRLAARPRHKDYGALTLFTRLGYHATIAHVVSPRCFYPAPEVESAIVVLDRRDPRIPLIPGAPFHEIIRTGFGHRRKVLRTVLKKNWEHPLRRAGAAVPIVEETFASLGISSAARPEELTLEQWIQLANALRPRD